MKIRYVTESSGYGGNEKYLLDLLSHFGVHVVDGLIAPFSSHNVKIRSCFSSAGVSVVDLPQLKGRYRYNYLSGCKHFKIPFGGIYHFSLPSTEACRWLLLAAAKCQQRYVITEHSVIANPCSAGWYPCLARFLFYPIRQFVYSRAQTVITVSNSNKELLSRKYGVSPTKIKVIHNGINTDLYSTQINYSLRRQFNIDDNAPLLIQVARLSAEKGSHTLITAFSTLVQEYPALRLLLVGDGPMSVPLRELAKALGVENHVFFCGFRSDIPQLLAAADVFVLPSLLEGFPYSVLEAMAAGIPIVASNVGGVAEAVDHGVTGLLSPPGDVAGLQANLRLLLNNPSLMKEMGARGRQRVISCFSLRRMVQETASACGIA